MGINLTTPLPQIRPKAIEWAKLKSTEILSTGRPLSETEIHLAQVVGVTQSEFIRLSIVPELPLPRIRN